MSKLITIETIPHNRQLYSTSGDYCRDESGDLHIFVSDTGNELYNALIGLHELVEVLAMEKRGIPLQASTDFDLDYEKERTEGKHQAADEPGDYPRSPYRKEHRLASIVEELVAHDLEVDWDDYGAKVDAL
jgi:hypothetical protein